MTHPADQQPPLAPNLVVDNARAALAFYEKAFGAQVLSVADEPNSGKVMHSAVLINGGLVMVNDDFPEMSGGAARSPQALGGTPVTLHLTVDDADAVFNRAVEAGATVSMPLADMFWGSRYGKVVDPFGHEWSIGTPTKQMTEEELQAAMKAAEQQPG